MWNFLEYAPLAGQSCDREEDRLWMEIRKVIGGPVGRGDAAFPEDCVSDAHVCEKRGYVADFDKDL